MLLTAGKPLYLTAHITGGHGFSSEITDTPTWSPPSKIAARYLAPYLDEFDKQGAASNRITSSEPAAPDGHDRAGEQTHTAGAGT
jgi:hypothetical protein